MENAPRTRVAICVPCTDVVQTFFAYDLANLMAFTTLQRPEIELALFFFPGSLIPKQREGLAKECVQHGLTHALFLDSDMRFPPDTLLRLLDRKERIVAVNYIERRPPYRPVAFVNLEAPLVRLFTTEDSTGLEAVHAIGGGVMLIDVDVFRKMPEPWFAVTWNPETKVYMGEDVWFCCRARDHGETVWIDHDVTKDIRHIGGFEYGMTQALEAQAQRDAHAARNGALVAP